MNKDNQTSSDSINAYIPISANSSNDSTTETFATIVQETTLPTTTTEKGGSSGMISFICIGILACNLFLYLENSKNNLSKHSKDAKFACRESKPVKKC